MIYFTAISVIASALYKKQTVPDTEIANKWLQLQKIFAVAHYFREAVNDSVKTDTDNQ